MIERLICGATVVTEGGVAEVDLGIADGGIAALFAPGTVPEAAEVVEASGLWLLPEAIDAHTHFSAAPDGTANEVLAGTCGAAAGGVTTVIELPHSRPPATDLPGLCAKREMFAAHAAGDFALWAGLTADNAGEIAAMAAAGAVAFKGFLCSPRADGAAPDATALPAIGDGALVAAMRAVAAAGSVVGIHA